MAKRLQLIVAATILILALSGCTVRVTPDSAENDPATIRSSQDQHSWSVTHNGCTVNDQTPQHPDPKPVNIRERDDVTGPLAKSWTWSIENTSFQRFHVRLYLEGPMEAPYYHANALKYSLEGGCGQRPIQSGANGGTNLQVSLSTQPAGTIVDYNGEGVMTLGIWTLKLEAQEAVAVYDAEIIVDY